MTTANCIYFFSTGASWISAITGLIWHVMSRRKIQMQPTNSPTLTHSYFENPSFLWFINGLQKLSNTTYSRIILSEIPKRISAITGLIWHVMSRRRIQIQPTNSPTLTHSYFENPSFLWFINGLQKLSNTTYSRIILSEIPKRAQKRCAELRQLVIVLCTGCK